MSRERATDNNIREKVNPDGVISRGYLKEPFRFFDLDNVESDAIQPHYHEFHKVIIFISGDVEYMAEGTLFRLRPGNILIIPAYSVHQPLISPDTAYKRYVLWLSCEAAETLGASDIFTKCRITGNKNKVETAAPDPMIKEIIDYINANLKNDLSIENLSKKFYISKSSLIKRFKLVTGYTPHRYITNKRLGKSADMISSGMNIADVAEENGYEDYSSFFRAFKKIYGVGPGKLN